jgi:hypothetical protein
MKSAMTAPKTTAKSKRPANLPLGRWLGDFPKLSAAEKALVSACARGEPWRPAGWDNKRPKAATTANVIRAGLIRFLLLGGDARNAVHELGVMLDGAWIDDKLHLHQLQLDRRLSAKKCHFGQAPLFMKARLPELNLSGSLCPGIDADWLQISGDLFLCDDFHASGEVRLLSAEIGGNLSCTGGLFQPEDGAALNCQGLTVKGFLTLSAPAVEFYVFRSRTNAEIAGAIYMTEARVGTLVDGDDLSCWRGGGHILDGFRYDRIIGFTKAAQRIEWLKLQCEDQLTTDFKPQPWEQLIKVLREMGHPEDASTVAIAKQNQWRVATATAKRPFGEKVRRSMHWVYGLFAGYGHRPIWTVYWMVGMWFVWSLLFMAGAHYNYMGPSTPLLNSPTLAPAIDAACGHAGQPGKQNWTECSEVPAEYSTFQPFVYSLDLILPLVDLQQDSDWAPIVEDPPGTDLFFGVILRWAMWFEILFGWVASLTLVAVLGRLVEKD